MRTNPTLFCFAIAAIAFAGCASPKLAERSPSSSRKARTTDETIAVACNPDEKTGEPEFVARAIANGLVSWRQTMSYGEKKTYETAYRIAGKLNVEDKYGSLVGTDPVVLFVSAEGEYSTIKFGTRKGKTDKYMGDYNNDHGSGRLECEPGPAFDQLAAAFEAAPTMARETYNDANDRQLAGTCRGARDARDTYSLRAIHSGFGDVSLQLNPKSEKGGLRPGGMSMYDYLAFGANGVLVFKTGKDMLVNYGSETFSRVYLERKTVKDAKGRAAHRVILVPDLKDPNQPMVELMCAEAHAYPTIERFAKEAAEMPKALPKKPGTLAGVDPSLCGMENLDRAQDRVSKWSRLIMDMKLSGDAMITGMGMDFRNEKKCPNFQIMVSTRAGADEIRRVLGESLDGLGIQFEIGEE